MIFDFDITEARKGAVSVHNALGSINTNLSLSAPCRRSERFYHYINPEKRAEHAYKYTLSMYNQCITV